MPYFSFSDDDHVCDPDPVQTTYMKETEILI